MTQLEMWKDGDWWWVRVYDQSYRFETREEAEDFFAAHA